MQPKETLKEARKKAGINQTEAAAKCGVSFSAYEKWERGVNEIPPATLAGCLLLLGASPKAALQAATEIISR
jgi:transcriptional regulator with XRE-family HTH domain